MRKPGLLLVSLAVGVLFVSSCAVIQTPVGVGGVYTSVNFPTPNLAVGVESNLKPTKVGKSEAQNILGLVVIGDCSIEAAMKAGQITKVHHVDSRVESVLGVFAKRITIVYGE